MPVPSVPDDAADRADHQGPRSETRVRPDRTPPTWGRVRVRRTDDGHRWWPMPLWLWAVVIAVLTTLAILVVGAIGGHAVLVEALLGEVHRRECRTPLPGGCLRWQQMYVMVGIGAFAFVVVYRWTIGRRVTRRWPRR